MHALADCLQIYVEKLFRAALARDPDGFVRPVLVGPPDAALRETFALLTAEGQRDWQPALDPVQREVVVLLVDNVASPASARLSRTCYWDYAVSVRNSCRRVLILATRASWDNRPESLANTTETIGEIGATMRGNDDPLQAHLVTTITARIGLEEPEARELLRLVRTEAANLEPAARDAMTWEVLERLLSAAPSASSADAACRAAGFPVVGNSGKGFRESYAVLSSLGSYVATVGLREAIDQMKATNAAQQNSVVASLDSLQVHLSASMFSPTLLKTSPARYFQVSAVVPSWYDTLSADVLEEILAELNQGPTQGRLSLACTNALVGGSTFRGGCFVVATGPELQAATASAPVPVVTYTRRLERAAPVPLSPIPTDPFQISDPSPPVHRRPIKYRVEAPGHRPGSVDIIALDTFACGGLSVAPGAERIGIPVRAARAGTWTQELVLSRSGAVELLVFHASTVTHVTVGLAGEPSRICPTVAGRRSVSFALDVEDGDTFDITLSDSAGAAIGSWTLLVIVRDVAEVSPSRLDALIREHRTRRKCVPHAPDTALHRLEVGSYLSSADSWRPVLACWAAEAAGRAAIDWSGARVLGDIQPQIDPRPAITPSPQVLAAREEVRALLHQEQRCLSEIEVNAEALAPLLEAYLRCYRDWLASDPQSACWQDVLAIHAAEWNAQAGRNVATEEPVVILLSPLHPIRLAWHAVAQQQLVDSLPHPCSGAGLISPSHCPDAGLLYLSDGQISKPRAFFSLPCDHPHWAVLVNAVFLDRAAPRAAVMQKLAQLGLQVQAITGGFTAQQTEDSIREVNRLLPARAILRVGIVGDGEASSDCGEGVFRWSETHLSQDALNPAGCFQLEVFDTRGAVAPSPEQLADLSEITAERVRWFKQGPASSPQLDLTIIDQLGVRSHEASTGDSRSAITRGGLFRVRVREDFQDARAILESRVAMTRFPVADLPSLLAETLQVYEQLCSKDAQHTHYRFMPNQDAVGSRLRNAIFLSLTSSQIDPACVVRGTVGQSGYLWDYELPGVLSGGEGGLGYYLVAQPTAAMLDAVERAASLVASPPPSIPGLLEEVSRRGIPILKRLASGGSQSRGELGLLLATRLLQDAFRPHPTVARLPVWSGGCIHLVLPVDPYEELFDRLRRELLPASSSAQRPDLIVIAIRLQDARQPVEIKLTPVEIKYRATGMAATDMREALKQAHSMGTLLQALLVEPSKSDLWRTCASAVLAQFLDFGFRIYAATWLHGHEHAEWTSSHQRVLQDVLEASARVTVNVAGRLVVFDGSLTTRVADLDGDHRQDTAIVSQEDARALLAGAPSVSAVADAAVSQLDFSFPSCSAGSQVPAVSGPAAWGVTTAPVQEPIQADPQASSPYEALKQPTSGSALPEVPAEDHGSLNSSAPVSRIPPEVRLRVRNAFEGFVGNEPAISRLSNDILRALIEQPPHLAKNYLFTGLPSTGKTELARRMARALGLPFVKLDGRGVSSRDKLFEMVNGELTAHNLNASQIGQQIGLPVFEYPPLIVFIDEVHLVPRALQEALLTMLEAADRSVVLSDHVALVRRATFLFATTRVSDVDAAFASRCDEIQLREYTEAEVAQILRWKLPYEAWQEDVYQTVARLGRCVPRIAIQLAEALETAVMVSEEQKSLPEHLDDVRRAREIDAGGLTRMDFEYLAILERSNGPVGEQNLLNQMRTVDKDRILNEVEPFLVRLGFIRHSQRGRELTSEGREYILAHRVRV